MQPTYNWLVEYEWNNGYSCGCCRQTNNFTEEYDDLTLDELIDAIAIHLAGSQDVNKNYPETELINIYKRDDVGYSIKEAIERKVSSLMEEKRKLHAEKLQQVKLKSKKDAEEFEKLTYKKLKKKYEGV